MLVLARKVGESNIIANDVTLTVLSIKGGQVRIGIKAPEATSIHREEIYKKIAKNLENKIEGEKDN